MVSFEELVSATFLLAWVIFVVTVLTRYLYKWMLNRGFDRNVAVYYNRKIIHVLVGGVCAIMVPFLFKTLLFPFLLSMLLAIFTYLPHKTGKLMEWFQTKDNLYEVSFAIMWGTIISLGWLLSGGDFFIGVLPLLFMSIGDAITGLVRNFIFRKRTKSWWGNLAMASFSLLTGTILGVAGIFAGGVASIVEHFEFHPIDDNITVPLTSFVILISAKLYAPWLLTF